MPNALYTISEFKFAEYFLNYRPVEPIVGALQPIRVEPFQCYADQISILNLWDFVKLKVTAYNPQIVIYSHGMVTNSPKTTGLSLVIDNKKNIELTKSIVDILLNENKLPAKARQKQLSLTEADMKMIDSLLIDIQVCSISHLALRACNVGNDPDYLLRLAKLFNAKYISAPTQRDFFTKADFYRISKEDMDKLAEQGAKLKSYEQKAAEIAAAKGKAKAQIKESGVTMHGSGANRLALFIQKKTHSTFNLLALATSAQAVENFYRDRFNFQKPVTFSTQDFFGDVSLPSNKQPLEMRGKTMGLFGLSRGANDIIKFPRDPAYAQLIRVVKNEDYIGDLPMYIPPDTDADLDDLNLRQRLARRIQRFGQKLKA